MPDLWSALKKRLDDGAELSFKEPTKLNRPNYYPQWITWSSGEEVAFQLNGAPSDPSKYQHLPIIQVRAVSRHAGHQT